MIVNFEEVDKKIERILNILTSLGYSYEIFSAKRYNIIDNNVSFAEKRNVGCLTMNNNGIISLRMYGYDKRVTLKREMHGNEVIFKQNTPMSEINASIRKLVRRYEKTYADICSR